jgi:hypothetical protein
MRRATRTFMRQERRKELFSTPELTLHTCTKKKKKIEKEDISVQREKRSKKDLFLDGKKLECNMHESTQKIL